MEDVFGNRLKNKISLENNNGLFGDIVLQYAVTRLVEGILGLNANGSSRIKDNYINLLKKDDNTRRTLLKIVRPGTKGKDLAALINDFGFKCSESDGKISFKDDDNFTRFKKAVVALFNNSLRAIKQSANISESRVIGSKVINESKILEKEYRRLWNIK